MKLNQKERRVLAAIELDARQTPAEIRQRTGYREHTVRYAIHRLLAAGVIRLVPFINVYPLGYSDYAFYFSLAAGTKKQKQALLDGLVQSPHVSWVAKLGGDFQYGFAICARDVTEVMSFLDEISNNYSDVFFEKALSIRVSLTLLPRSYLDSSLPNTKAITFGRTGSQVEIDAKDHLILSALANSNFSSVRDLARSLSMPHTTLEHRIHKLEQSGVIAGYIYQVDARKFGMQLFKLLVFVKGMNTQLRKKLLHFAEAHHSIAHFIECLGNWDYELGVEVENSEDVVTITQELYNEFGKDINTIRVMSIFGHPKVSNYPFR